MSRYLLVACIACLALSGCRQIQLRNHAAVQARTVSDMHTQQVLDNLAMFMYDPGSFPSFSTFKQGAAQVQDRGGLGSPTGFGRFTAANVFGLTTFSFQPSLERTAYESWTTEPVNNARKLELMRCAYQNAVYGRRPADYDCPNCQKRFNHFYTGDFKKSVSTVESGITTSDCLSSESTWFHAGCKNCIPKSCDCLYIGSYCGMYVWVFPEGRNELSKLTLAILDFATNDPPQVVKRTKNVEVILDEDLAVTSTKITATIGIDEDPAVVLSGGEADLKTEAARTQLRQILNKYGYTLAKVRELNDEEYKTFIDNLTSDERAAMVRLLVQLGWKFNDLKPANAIALVPEAAHNQVRMMMAEIHSTTASDADKAAAKAKLQTLNKEIGTGLRSIEIPSPTEAAPIVIPARPSNSNANDALETLQELNATRPIQ